MTSVRKKPTEQSETKTKTKTVKATKKSQKLDLDTFTVSQTELASILGIATANITPMLQNGNLVKDAEGRLNLRDSVSAYCKRMRERKDGTGKSDLELENLALKNEKLKESLRTWRMQRDREVAMAILDAQRNAMQRLRDECKLVPALCQVIDGMIDCINRVDVENISYTVEGETDEDND